MIRVIVQKTDSPAWQKLLFLPEDFNMTAQEISAWVLNNISYAEALHREQNNEH